MQILAGTAVPILPNNPPAEVRSEKISPLQNYMVETEPELGRNSNGSWKKSVWFRCTLDLADAKFSQRNTDK